MQQCQVKIHSIFASMLWSKWMVHEKWSPQWGVQTHDLSVMSLLPYPLDHGYLPDWIMLYYIIILFLSYTVVPKMIPLNSTLTYLNQTFLEKCYRRLLQKINWGKKFCWLESICLIRFLTTWRVNQK
jgi:hypothetical protein